MRVERVAARRAGFHQIAVDVLRRKPFQIGAKTRLTQRCSRRRKRGRGSSRPLPSFGKKAGEGAFHIHHGRFTLGAKPPNPMRAAWRRMSGSPSGTPAAGPAADAIAGIGHGHDLALEFLIVVVVRIEIDQLAFVG